MFKKNQGTEQIIERLYKELLHRNVNELDDIEYWRSRLESTDIFSVVRDFCQTEEFFYKNMDNQFFDSLPIIKRSVSNLTKISTNFSNKIWFMHIRKSSGSSLIQDIEKHLKYPFIRLGEASHPEIVDVNRLKIPINFNLIVSHIPLFRFKQILSEYSIFSIIRDPRSRLLSTYRFWTSNRVISWMKIHNSKSFSILNDSKELKVSDWIQNLLSHKIDLVYPQTYFLSMDYSAAEISPLDLDHNHINEISNNSSLSIELSENIEGIKYLVNKFFNFNLMNRSKVNLAEENDINSISSLDEEDLLFLSDLSAIDYELILKLEKQKSFYGGFILDKDRIFLSTVNRLGFSTIR